MGDPPGIVHVVAVPEPPSGEPPLLVGVALAPPLPIVIGQVPFAEVRAIVGSGG